MEDKFHNKAPSIDGFFSVENSLEGYLGHKILKTQPKNPK